MLIQNQKEYLSRHEMQLDEESRKSAANKYLQA